MTIQKIDKLFFKVYVPPINISGIYTIKFYQDDKKINFIHVFNIVYLKFLYFNFV